MAKRPQLDLDDVARKLARYEDNPELKKAAESTTALTEGAGYRVHCFVGTLFPVSPAAHKVGCMVAAIMKHQEAKVEASLRRGELPDFVQDIVDYPEKVKSAIDEATDKQFPLELVEMICSYIH